MTGHQLIDSVLRIVTGGREFSPEQVAGALECLNLLKDSLSAESFLQYNSVVDSFPVTAGVSTYTVGPTGGYVTTRPMQINSAWIRELDNDYGLNIITDGEYDALSPKETLRSYPTDMVIAKTAPNISITLYPVPDRTFTLYLDSYKPIADFTLDGDIALPPEYVRMFKFNLAVDLYNEYPAISLPREIAVLAEQTKRIIRKANSSPVPQAKFDICSGSRYNIYRGN